MIPTRLICVDGLPGSGKSTTSQRLCLHLLKLGHEARWYYEHGPDSPIWRGAERFRFTESGITDPMVVQELMLSRWKSLGAEIETGSTVALMESSLLHTTIGVMVAMDFDEVATLNCVREVTQAILPLHPVSIYLFPDDVGEALKAICAQRRHDQFEAPLIALLSKSAYARTHGLEDFDGAVRFFRRCREITDRAFSALPIPKLAIDYSARDWEAYERQITDFLKVPDMAPISDQVDRPSRFVGRYKDSTSGADLVVAADDKGLYLDDDRGTRLMHDRGDVFYINAVWIGISFNGENEGVFQRLEMKGHLPDVGAVWVRADAPT
jgi:thymidylate kinase